MLLFLLFPLITFSNIKNFSSYKEVEKLINKVYKDGSETTRTNMYYVDLPVKLSLKVYKVDIKDVEEKGSESKVKVQVKSMDYKKTLLNIKEKIKENTIDDSDREDYFKMYFEDLIGNTENVEVKEMYINLRLVKVDGKLAIA